MFPSEPPRLTLEGFDLIERLGAGAAGEVFLARSRGGKLVAVKTLARSPNDDVRSSDAFVREASVCARLRHPCIVQVRAFLEERGLAALVFEYVPGVALARVLRLSEARGVRLPDSAAWHIVERVLEGLAYAHGFREEAGKGTPIVHRDLSPSNVLLDWEGGVKIGDFGIAKVLGVSPTTRLGLIKGTPGCMAPEQARGEVVNERADVYAAGLLAWRLATGRQAFGKHQKDEMELLRAMRHPKFPPLAAVRPDLPAALLDAVGRSLEPDPERRTIGAAEFAAVVRAETNANRGAEDLTVLLRRWKQGLERAVKRSPAVESELAAQAPDHTLRYEEAALAFDDEQPLDTPTYDAHALPSESDIAGGDDSERPPPLDGWNHPSPLPPAELAFATGRPRTGLRGPALVLGVFACIGVLGSLLALQFC